jgi:hypothetical protein
MAPRHDTRAVSDAGDWKIYQTLTGTVTDPRASTLTRS